MNDPDCIFCRIVAGDIPCHRLYEDEHALAFLDVGPVSRGHCLLIPKAHAVELDDLLPGPAAALGKAMPGLVAAVKTATGCDGLNVLQNNGAAAGQAVMHAHFHLIPRYKTLADPNLEDDAPESSSGHAEFDFHWPAGRLGDGDAADLKAKIVAALSTAS